MGAKDQDVRCRQGDHTLREVQSGSAPNIGDMPAAPTPGDEADWVHKKCTVCDAQVVDFEYDGRVNPGYFVPLTFDERRIAGFLYSVGL